MLWSSRLLFQSTRPLRGGTFPTSPRLSTYEFQSTRPLRGGTLASGMGPKCWIVFQSTRPLRGGTGVRRNRQGDRRISIHPPLAGRDEVRRHDDVPIAISIHPPLAGRDIKTKQEVLDGLFQSTRPLRGGTSGSDATARRRNISIHPPLAGRDYGWHRNLTGSCISIHPPLAGRDL